MSNDVYKYDGEAACVTWDERLCIHVRECTRAAGELFVSGRDPWCMPNLVQISRTKEIVERCPTGALAHEPNDGSLREVAASENTITVALNGPLFVRGDLDIDGAEEEMPGVRFRAALCRCGESKRKPFCDNAHENAGFRDTGAVGEQGKTKGDASEEQAQLVIKRAPNGPLLLTGNVTIFAASGRRAWIGTRAALCRCGYSNNKPFCDGSHKGANFEAD